MRALHIYAGPQALAHIRQHGLRPEHISTVPGAAGGPKGLILGPLDRFIFGHWLSQSTQTVDLVGASIGAWRMASACLTQPAAAFERLQRDYIHQHYQPPAGQKRVSAAQISREFGASLQAFYGGRIDQVLQHPRYRLHIVTAHGRRLLAREHPLRTPLGYGAAWLSNALARPALGLWLERVVFSSKGALPFDASDYRSLQRPLTEANFMAALQASCAIPFALQAVHDIAGAPPGAYWDGGLTDYHLHLRWQRPAESATLAPHNAPACERAGIVLYPHFQRHIVPGWLDKALKWRHGPTAALAHTLVLAPNPAWVQTLPNAKLPDRSDFMRYGQDLNARIQAWSQAASAAQQLADEFAQWLQAPDPQQVTLL